MFGLITQSCQNMPSDRRKARPRELIPFIGDADIGQEHPRRISLPLQLPSKRIAHGTMSAVATNEILTLVVLSRTVRACNLYRNATSILLEAHDFVPKKRLGQSRSFRCFQQQGFGAVLWQDQNSRCGTPLGKNTEIYFCGGFRLTGDPEIDFREQCTFR